MGLSVDLASAVGDGDTMICRVDVGASNVDDGMDGDAPVTGVLQPINKGMARLRTDIHLNKPWCFIIYLRYIELQIQLFTLLLVPTREQDFGTARQTSGTGKFKPECIGQPVDNVEVRTDMNRIFDSIITQTNRPQWPDVSRINM